ncbi:class I SAM-dependent methyltransferase [Mycobacterium colombiense]|uniref:class I SAM-dependent methyltransferase n=1 Tax=Mycobacterium colombiense TaxID=339268 RepID=UPI002009EC9E|nr:class I SAM-dependent methyltransferase [Mycobacterium colombiense]MCK8643380.1 class I SAM-dependent methyltransferase [Mycobacterium colombiense]
MDSTHEPAPPARLRWRVHGNLDKSSYFEVGRALAKNIQDLCATEGREFSSFANILDFGSGCGRVIQNFKNQSGQRRLYATDIDPDLVSWGKSNLHGIEWSLNGYWPPMLFEDNSFDLIYGISVFTHLDEDFQHAWLRELQRIARPGAILILTVHGEHVIRGLQMPDSSLLDTFEERGFVFLPLSSGRFKADGFPDFYQTSFHTKKYICNEWSAYFEILNYAERGITDHQDAVVLQKR